MFRRATAAPPLRRMTDYTVVCRASRYLPYSNTCDPCCPNLNGPLWYSFACDVALECPAIPLPDRCQPKLYLAAHLNPATPRSTEATHHHFCPHRRNSELVPPTKGTPEPWLGLASKRRTRRVRFNPTLRLDHHASCPSSPIGRDQKIVLERIVGHAGTVDTIGGDLVWRRW